MKRSISKTSTDSTKIKEKVTANRDRCDSAADPVREECGGSVANLTNTWVLLVLVVSTCLMAVNVYELQHIKAHQISVHDLMASVERKEVPEFAERKPSFVVYGKSPETGHLKHVFAVLERLGFQQKGNDSSDWDLMWAHDYPFRSLYAELSHLKPHQKARSRPRAMFIQKSNSHRGIRIRELPKLDLESSGTFVQEFVGNPLLVDGYKFDIGLYTVLTSIDPLRVYVYNGEVLFRFCPVKYHPFDPEVLDKYVVGDDYLPVWQVPSLQKYYVDLGYSMKESFNAYVRSKGRDPTRVWEQVEEAIRLAYLKKEPLLIEAAARYQSPRNFFEMVRFDFVVDEDLNVYMMEANMSPNLSSAHFPPNRLLYEQVLFNLFALVGVGRRLHAPSLETRDREEALMQVAEKNVAVSAPLCSEARCEACLAPECAPCRPCLSSEAAGNLRLAYLEHVNRMDCKRVFPPAMSQTTNITSDLQGLSPANQMVYRWFWGKCEQDKSWCS
ncbi:probable tubulin polyglutamylase ttll-15 isoform X2 [Bacillus rossius redtenbacheri]|uniref:probable tubulin polyglutamylase ttll-15 isoform X2 n=1 Tax=Bacillus rossius redtenbacheri TaxID=93214 RepID=UPI002FDDE4DA